jgi:hypothetical protein
MWRGFSLFLERDSKLYRTVYGTFEEYCRERWSIERRQAYRLIEASEAVKNLNVSNWTQIPQTESQAHPLSRLEPALR